MNEKRIYRALPVYSDYEIKEILKNDNLEELAMLSLSVGEYHRDWKFAQDICVKLADNENEIVRANAVLGFAYIARTKKKLSKYIVKPLIFRELRRAKEYKWRIEDAICDINIYLGWNLAFRHK